MLSYDGALWGLVEKWYSTPQPPPRTRDPAKPLQIITGRGNHSYQGKAVLLPAVRAALVEEGWDVSAYSAGIVVRGRT